MSNDGEDEDDATEDSVNITGIAVEDGGNTLFPVADEDAVFPEGKVSCCCIGNAPGGEGECDTVNDEGYGGGGGRPSGRWKVLNPCSLLFCIPFS